MAKRRDWASALEQKCRYCGMEHPATPEYFSKRAGTAAGVTTVCLACYAVKRQPAPEGMKRCGTCFAVKPVAEYCKRKTSKDGLRSDCNSCVSQANRAYKAANAEKVRKYKQANRPRYAALQAKYRAINPEKAKQQSKLDRDRHRVQRNAASRAWYYANHEENKAKAREHMRAFYRANPEVVIRNSMAQRTKRRAWELRFITKEWMCGLFKRHNGRCFYCGRRVGRPPQLRFHIDHFIPLSKGGTNDPENLVLSCQPCNNSKYSKLPWEFMPEKFSPPEQPAAD